MKQHCIAMSFVQKNLIVNICCWPVIFLELLSDRFLFLLLQSDVGHSYSVHGLHWMIRVHMHLQAAPQADHVVQPYQPYALISEVYHCQAPIVLGFAYHRTVSVHYTLWTYFLCILFPCCKLISSQSARGMLWQQRYLLPTLIFSGPVPD